MTKPQLQSDILILGATGYCGVLITRYLSSHPQRAQFTLALGGRSRQKLEQLVKDLGLTSDEVRLVQVDVTNENDVEEAVKSTKVVISAVGPYWTWGTTTVGACARNGVHYVDLNGEPAWSRKIIHEYDYLATKTHAIIVAACGYDSIPSDYSVYLSAKTLRTTAPDLFVGKSTTVHSASGGVSGGTINTALTTLDSVPRKVLEDSSEPYALSPIVSSTKIGGLPLGFKFRYKLTVPGLNENYIGCFFPMSSANTGLVQRTFGLLELYERDYKDKKSHLQIHYGPQFLYEEFLNTKGSITAVLISSSIVFIVTLLMIKPFRFLARKILPQPGQGPSESSLHKGFFKAINITSSAPSDLSSKPTYVKSVMQGKGDPGYLLTSMMIAESALCFLLPTVSSSTSAYRDPDSDNVSKLTPLAQRGGILTPVSAFGDELITRLEDTGKFSFSSEVL